MFNIKNTARLAVTAGLCASIAMGGMPLTAIAAEVEGEALDAAALAASAVDEAPGENGGVRDGATEEAALPASTQAPLSRGAGTAEDPYLVETVADLQEVAKKVNEGDASYSTAHYKLAAEIDLAGVDWAPIGRSGASFKGVFDGAGHTISNLVTGDGVDAGAFKTSGVGLFGVVESPAVLRDITVNGATVAGKAQVGVIAGSAYTGTLQGCKVIGKVVVTGNYKVGGLAGEGYAKMADCSVEAADGSVVTGIYAGDDFEGDNVGGLVGFRGEGAIVTSGCKVSGVKVSGTRKVGGLIGSAFVSNRIEDCSVARCAVSTNATVAYAEAKKDSMGVGGLVGLYSKSGSPEGTLKDCSISDIALSVEDEDLAKKDLVTLGYASGGLRGNADPDSRINVSSIVLSGANTGSNAEKKFPGSASVNGSATISFKGSGTAEDPYRVSTAADLEALASAVNDGGIGFAGRHFKVSDGAMIDMSARGGEWKGIGTDANRFMGAFDGNGATVKGLEWSLFSGIDGATIENLKLEVAIDATGLGTEDEREVIGGLVDGALMGSCTIRGIEVSGSVSGDDYVGGVLGGRAVLGEDDAVIIEDCVNNATITSGAKGGGIAGYALNRKPANAMPGTVLVKSCINNGAVKAQYAGGISGYVASTAFEACVNTGKIEGTLVAGGIVGTANSGTEVTGCKNTAEVTCDGAAGGIMGSSASGGNVVSKSANTASVTGVTNAGGIIGGSAAAGDFVDNCYNGGAITATGDGESTAKPVIAGGIFGYNNSGCPVRACMNDGKIVADGANAEVYQIGKSGYWYAEATGSKVVNSYYIQDGKIVLAPGDGKGEGTPQGDMTRGELAGALNTAGGVEGFWQAQNDSVQPDPLIPGIFDDEESLVAQVLDADGKVVEGYDSLAAALSASEDGQTVKLVKGVKLDKAVSITKSIVLDLGGNELSYSGDGQAIEVYTKKGASEVSATIQNGTVKAGVVGVFAYRANATLRDLAIEAKTGVNVGYPDESGSYWANVVIEEGTRIVASDTGVLVCGPYLNATELPENARLAALTMNGGVIETPGYAISGNGTYQGTEIAINGGKLSSTDGAAIYHPQIGTLTLAGGELSGSVGVQMCSGKLVVPSDSAVKVSGTGEDERDSKTEGDGLIVDGAAISIVNRDYPGGAPVADIKGGAFTSQNTEAVLAYTWKDKAATDWEDAGDTVDVSGGSFNTRVPEALLGDGCGVLEQDAGGNYVVHKHALLKVDGVSATIDAAGSKEHYKCSACDGLFWDAGASRPVVDPAELVIDKLQAVTVTFDDCIGPKDDKVVVRIAKGGVVPVKDMPAAPSLDGYKFLGWFIYDEVSQIWGAAFDPSDPVTEDLLVGAKWEKLPGEPGSGGKPSAPSGEGLAQTGDASVLAMAATGLAGAAAVATGALKRRRAE